MDADTLGFKGDHKPDQKHCQCKGEDRPPLHESRPFFGAARLAPASLFGNKKRKANSKKRERKNRSSIKYAREFSMSSLPAPLREGAAHIENRSSILVRSWISRFLVQIFPPRWGRTFEKCDPPPGVKQKSPKASLNQGRGVIGEPSRREPPASRERAKRLPGESRERAAREPKGFPERAASEPRASQKGLPGESRERAGRQARTTLPILCYTVLLLY